MLAKGAKYFFKKLQKKKKKSSQKFQSKRALKIMTKLIGDGIKLVAFVDKIVVNLTPSVEKRIDMLLCKRKKM